MSFENLIRFAFIAAVVVSIVQLSLKPIAIMIGLAVALLVLSLLWESFTKGG